MKTYQKPYIKVREMSGESMLAASPTVEGVDRKTFVITSEAPETGGGQVKQHSVWDTDDTNDTGYGAE